MNVEASPDDRADLMERLEKITARRPTLVEPVDEALRESWLLFGEQLEATVVDIQVDTLTTQVLRRSRRRRRDRFAVWGATAAAGLAVVVAAIGWSRQPTAIPSADQVAAVEGLKIAPKTAGPATTVAEPTETATGLALAPADASADWADGLDEQLAALRSAVDLARFPWPEPSPTATGVGDALRRLEAELESSAL